MFEAWEPSTTYTSLHGALPPSPFFWHSLTLLESGPLSLLLRDMCHLGDLFLSHATRPRTALDAEYNAHATNIVRRLGSLPSAFASEHPMTADWMYETCRIAAIIYAGAIFQRISFSEAANPLQNAIYKQFLQQSGHEPPAQLYLSVLLFEALQLADSVDTWEKFPDVLYWVCAVGAMSARTRRTRAQTEEEEEEEEAEEARYGGERHITLIHRCFNMHATRSLLVVVFGEAKLVGAALKKLLVLQRLVQLPG